MISRRFMWGAAIALFLVAYLGSSLIGLVVDYYWFDSLGFLGIFGTILTTRFFLGVAGGVFAFLVLYGNVALALRQIGEPAQYLPPEIVITPLGQLLTQKFAQRTALLGTLAIGAVVGFSASTGWEAVQLYLNGGVFNEVEPIFGRDVGFYVFTLPFLDTLQSFFWSLGLLTALMVGFVYFLKLQAARATPGNVITLSGFSTGGRLHAALVGAALLGLMAWGFYLDRFLLMAAPGGLFTGPGYADINGTIPVLALKIATALLCAGFLVFALLRGRYRFLVGGALLLAVVYVGGNLYGSLLQRFVVSPNELEKEREFLTYHIQATRKAYALDKVVERPLSEEADLTGADIRANRGTINNIRLWDHEPLLDTFSQIQEIRTYYDFLSVDNDRYRIGGELRQTMLSPRELSAASLPSRTWVNERLTFTHGYGLTLGPVNRVDEQGLPVLFVKDLPPRSEAPEFKIERPEIYYGEVPDQYVFVRTAQQEFNYPEGEKNIFSTYQGEGGIWLGGLLRRLVFAAHLRDVKILLADDFSPETRILLFRNVPERVRKIAPFFHYDHDPYMVIHDGRLAWILDAYTTSERYPYSEVVGEVGNYMRNPVKVVVDAYTGETTFYLVDTKDPLAAAYARMFPGLLRPLAAMPQGLREHLRHPVDYFSVQAFMYATYHMVEVNTFYNKEDQWEVPVVGKKRMEPYFTVMKLPSEKTEEFILMLPFTPRLKDNLSAWMVARSDGELYGQLVVYTFPKQRLVFGPKQMVARINQDSEVSQQITLWDQSGSNVIRGTLLVIPIESSLIYIQPLYLRADEGRIPELKRVVVGYQNSIAMGKDLEDALGRIFGAGTSRAAAAAAARRPQAPSTTTALPGQNTPATRAMQHYTDLLKASRDGNWSRFGRELEALGAALREVTGATK